MTLDLRTVLISTNFNNIYRLWRNRFLFPQIDKLGPYQLMPELIWTAPLKLLKICLSEKENKMLAKKKKLVLDEDEVRSHGGCRIIGPKVAEFLDR